MWFRAGVGPHGAWQRIPHTVCVMCSCHLRTDFPVRAPLLCSSVGDGRVAQWMLHFRCPFKESVTVMGMLRKSRVLTSSVCSLRRTSTQDHVPGTPSAGNLSGGSLKDKAAAVRICANGKNPRQGKVSANESRSPVHVFLAPWCLSSSFIRARVRSMFGFASSRSHVKVFLFGTWKRK